jgi:catechol 2,3-dioxygenase-like lactoylglutathione lyase family enzyme
MAYFGFRIARDLTPEERTNEPVRSSAIAMRRVSLVVPDADAVLWLLRDVLGLTVTRDAPLESQRAKQTLGVPAEATLRFVTVEAPEAASTALGLLEADAPRNAAGPTAILVYSVQNLDERVAAARSVGLTASAPAPLGSGTVRGREARIAGPGIEVILQELEP